jgi:L-ascorbate metabolism protein UlaG (beta-lactamase superfamily)
MNIQYFGLSCLKFTTKQTQDISLLTDPFEPKAAGLKISRTKAQVVLTSNPDSPLANNLGLANPGPDAALHEISSPGEYEVNGIFIQALAGPNTETNLFYLDIEKVTFAFLGSLESPLENGQLEVLEGVDVLILPVGGKLTPKQAKQIVSQVEPRIVIPVFFKVPGLKPKLQPVDTFLKELGGKHIEHVDKLKLTKKDLPAEDRHVYVFKV